MHGSISQLRQYQIIFGSACLLALVPFFVSHPYFIHVFILFFIYGTLTQSWNLLAGYSGLISLGQQLFWGIGGYALAILWLRGVPVYISIFLGGIAALLSAVIIGYPSIRMKGAAFAIGTWMFAEAARIIIANSSAMGGTIGISLPIFSAGSKVSFYYMAMVVFFITLIAINILLHSKFGFGLVSIREDESAAESLGVNTVTFRFLSLLISAFFTGLIGAIYGAYTAYIQPYDVFSFIWMLDIIIASVLGGIGSFVGPYVGVVFFLILTEYFRYVGIELHIIFEGIFLLFVVLFFKKGIWGYIHQLATRPER